MTRGQNKQETPWWQSELATIRVKQRAYLKRRLPALSTYHEDLIGDTVLAVTRQLVKHPSDFPTSWFQFTVPADERERSHFHKLAMFILRRRMADLLRSRKRASMPHLSLDEELGAEHSAPEASSPERKILATQILQITSSLLDEMRPEERDLVALISEDGFRKTLSMRERQRLHRIRRKLRDEISRRLGVQIADLLRIIL